MTDDTDTNGASTETDAERERRPDAASPGDVARLEQTYLAEGRPFARVTVVRREPPVSAHVGDRALVTLDGELTGWIGGVNCAQSVAVRTATQALKSGEPKLVGLAPDPADVERPGLEAFPMTCHSQGTLELFVEPVTSVPRLVVVGDSPSALALTDLVGRLGYDVTVVGDASELGDREVTHLPRDVDTQALADAMNAASWAVVASMGVLDDVGLEAALAAGVPYVGLVASERRAEELYATVAERTGRDVDDVRAAVDSPAGIDIGARTPEEVAVSILAGLVAARRADDAGTDGVAAGGADTRAVDAAVDADTDADAETATATAVDPVCGMDVVVGEAAATVDQDGRTYHFCGQGCADAFVDDPERFLEHAES